MLQVKRSAEQQLIGQVWPWYGGSPLASRCFSNIFAHRAASLAAYVEDLTSLRCAKTQTPFTSFWQELLGT